MPRRRFVVIPGGRATTGGLARREPAASVETLLAAVRKTFDDAVAAGRLTRAQADAALARAARRLHALAERQSAPTLDPAA